MELGVLVTDIVTLTLNAHPITEIRRTANIAKQAAQDKLSVDVPGSIASQISLVNKEILELELKLDEPKRRYEAYLRVLEDWERRRQFLVGDAGSPNTVAGLEEALKQHDALPGMLAADRASRLEKAAAIHAQLVQQLALYREVYGPVQRFVENHPLAKNRFDLEFEVSLTEFGLATGFFQMVNRAVSGSFYGTEEGAEVLQALTRTVDFNDPEALMVFLNDMDSALHTDNRSGHGQPVELGSQLRQGFSERDLYDYVFGMDYLGPRYMLQSKGKPIGQLSPGEKGTLLLMFYLLVDQGDIPLIMDQPEENLDNQTIYDLLVPAIKSAKSRRQVILVTHSPNLAVVGDADQVIRADFVGDSFVYSSGSIENPVINPAVVDVLEGTLPAFENREEKYLDSR